MIQTDQVPIFYYHITTTNHFMGDFHQVRDFWIDGKFYVFDTLFIKIYIKRWCCICLGLNTIHSRVEKLFCFLLSTTETGSFNDLFKSEFSV